MSNVFHQVYDKIHVLIGNYLRSRYASFRVTRPYIIKVDGHNGLIGKVAVVTGGSGSIGRACAFRLAAEGAKVYVCGLGQRVLYLLLTKFYNLAMLQLPHS